MTRLSSCAYLTSSFYLLLITSLGACAPTMRPKYSGFLDDYSQLRVSPKLDGALVWANNKKRISLYKMIMIDPVQVMMSEEETEKVDPRTLADLARFFEEEIHASMEDSYPVVNQPGFGVLRIRAAITNVHLGKPALNLMPGLSLLGLGLGGAAIEAELIDAQDNERVVQFVDAESGKVYRKSAGARPYGDARDVLRSWAILLRDSLDEAKGLHTSGEFRSSGNAWQ